MTIDEGLVRRLLRRQFPEWAGLPIVPVRSTGTVNAMYRLGDDMVVRLLRFDWGIDGMDREILWLPWLTPQLPVAVPDMVFQGEPDEGYPWRWCVYRWIEGEIAVPGGLANPDALATDLAVFLAALWRIDPSPGPPSEQSLEARDAPVRVAIDALRGIVDTEAVTAAWEADLHAVPWDGSPVWLHGDLTPGNMLIVEGRLAAVIDWSGLGVGDRATDLRIAWSVLPAAVRDDFLGALEVDEATRARARGRALAAALTQLACLRMTIPTLATNARYVIREVLAEHGR